MSEKPRGKPRAYHSRKFLDSREARALRILSEYLEPLDRFEKHGVDDTVVFMGSAQFSSREDAEVVLDAARARGRRSGGGELKMEQSAWYQEACTLAFRLSEWSKALDGGERRFVVCTGGGPGIMEAVNRGASEAKGLNVRLTISIPKEQSDNPYITCELQVHFHYFFMRKFCFVHLAKAAVPFSGGFGTLDGWCASG